MNKDATTAGVKKGGLINQAQIKILICYILDTLKDAVPAKQLSEELHFDGIANYFEVDTAFGALLNNGQIAIADAQEETYVITDKGSMVASELKTSLPFTVREMGCAIAVKLLNKRKNIKEYNIDIVECKNGYNVICSSIEDGTTMMSASIFAADLQQAQYMKNSFLEKAGIIFTDIVDTLTRNDNR